MLTLEMRFDQDMIYIYKTAKKECGYNVSRFLQMLKAIYGLFHLFGEIREYL